MGVEMMQPLVQSDLKKNNRRTVFECIRRNDGISRAAISRLTGISVPTVLKAVKFLIDSGFIFDGGIGKSDFGRKPHMLFVNERGHYSIGVDFLGSNVAIGVMDICNNVIYLEKYETIPSIDESFFSSLLQCIRQTVDNSGVDKSKILGAGITIPGIVDPDSCTVKKADYWGITESVNLRGYFSKLSTDLSLPIYIENDVNAAALGEYSVRGEYLDKDIICVSIGTGIGAGLIIDGKLRRGGQCAAGEIGNTVFEVNGRNTWLEEYFKFPIVLEKIRMSRKIHGNNFYDFDELLIREIEDILEKVVVCISNIVFCLDPDLLVFCGEYVDLLGDSFIDAFRHQLNKCCAIDVAFERNICEYPGLTGLGWLVMKNSLNTMLKEN